MEIFLYVMLFLVFILYLFSVVFFTAVFRSVEMTRKFCFLYAIIWFIAFPVGVIIELKRGTQK